MVQKVGIATIHKNTNYGANLQAFASCRYLNNLGCNAKVIDYDSSSSHLFSLLKLSWTREKNKTFCRKVKLGVALFLSMGWKHKRIKCFGKFRKKHIQLTSQYKRDQHSEINQLDAIICGSDQVWNIDITEGINPVYFGEVAGVKKRISYAASIGGCNYGQYENEVKRLVSQLDYCSVREENTARYLSDLTGRNVETVCDPVFLLEKTDYEGVSSKRKIKGDYILLYSVVHNDALTAIAKDYADRHGMKLVEICSAKDKKATHKQIATYGPAEFLSCFRFARTVFTNSFHGTAFSLIFEKDFYIVDNKAGGSRITNLLSRVGLSERLITENVESDFAPIDYDTSKKQLSEYVSSSKEFLDKALKSEKHPLAGEMCMSCGACRAVCKFDAIRLFENEEGFLTALVDEAKCVDCGACKRICPAFNKAKKHSSPSAYAFKADDEIRKNSTSGGAFAALALEIIKDGGAFYGAAQKDDLSVWHIRGENPDDLTKMQGTKYLPSDMSDCYAQVEADLLHGKKVLFSGTPCQVDALYRYVAAKRLPTDDLYTVDIICHGVPSPAFYRSYIAWLEKEYGKLAEYKFRSKKISWRGSSCYARLADGRELKNDKKLCGFMNVYYTNNITRERCYSCPYTSVERVSDLTISDCWGLEDMDKSFEDALGVSMVLVNTEGGRALFEQTSGRRVAVDLNFAKQPQLKQPAARSQEREEFWNEYATNGVKPLLKKYGGVRRASFKTVLSRLKKKLLR